MISGVVLVACAWIAGTVLAGPVYAPMITIPVAEAVMFPEYSREKRKRREKESAPEVMYHFSVLVGFLPFEKALREAARGDSPFHARLMRACREISRGAPVEKALEEMAEENPLLREEVWLLLACYRKGEGVARAMRTLAEEGMNKRALEKEGNASLLVEKYTLVISAGLLIPWLLGTSFSVVRSLDLPGTGVLGTGPDDSGLQDAVLTANQYYVPLMGLIVSVFLALAENKRDRIVFYASVIVPAASAVYALSLGSSIA